MIIVSLCDRTGNIVRPWSEAGYRCLCVDIQHQGITTVGNITYIGASILDCVSTWLPSGEKVVFAMAAPPCTHTAVSGSKHFRSKGPAKAAEAFQLIARCQQLLEWFGCPYLYEQPVSTTSTYCGPPNYSFDPCDFAGYLDDPSIDRYTKKTSLWTGGGFIMPTKRPVKPVKVCKQGSWIQKLGGASINTKNKRSETPRGFAQAVYEANRHLVEPFK